MDTEDQRGHMGMDFGNPKEIPFITLQLCSLYILYVGYIFSVAFAQLAPFQSGQITTETASYVEFGGGWRECEIFHGLAQN